MVLAAGATAAITGALFASGVVAGASDASKAEYAALRSSAESGLRVVTLDEVDDGVVLDPARPILDANGEVDPTSVRPAGGRPAVLGSIATSRVARTWIGRAKNGAVCVLAQERGRPGPMVGCGPPGDPSQGAAMTANAPPGPGPFPSSVGMVAHEQILIGAVPDGVASITVFTKSGIARNIAVEDNVFSVDTDDPIERLTYVREGRPHELLIGAPS